jgi:hypothetical protein
MRSFVGRGEIGLKTIWRFGFVGPGITADPVTGFLDVELRGAFRDGIIDHHSDARESSCSAGSRRARGQSP